MSAAWGEPAVPALTRWEKLAENQSNAPPGSSWTAVTAEDIKPAKDELSSAAVIYPRAPPVLTTDNGLGFYFQGCKAISQGGTGMDTFGVPGAAPARVSGGGEEPAVTSCLWPRPHPDFNHNPVGTSLLVNPTPRSTDS